MQTTLAPIAAAPRTLGYRVCVDSGPGWHRWVIVDRYTRLRYSRLESPGGAVVRPIERTTARAMVPHGSTLRPVIVP
jgi:hypothetical protein